MFLQGIAAISLILGATNAALLEPSLPAGTPLTLGTETKQDVIDKYNARQAQFAALQAAVEPFGAVSTKLGGHHQLNFLPAHMQEKVAIAEYYTDFAASYANMSGLPIDEVFRDLRATAIHIASPVTNNVYSYPNCDQVCNGASTSRYRTLDGTCNNVEKCVWGSSGSSLRRLLPPDYVNFNKPRVGTDFAYDIVMSTFDETLRPSDRITSSRGLSQMVMTFGQVLAHDITSTPARSVPDANNNPLEVDCVRLEATSLSYDECFMFNRDNPDFKRNFIRSASGIIDDGTRYVFGEREQMNLHTSFIDGSTFYGYHVDQKNRIVDPLTGKMISSDVTPNLDDEFPPTSLNQYCESSGTNECFVGGDSRININFGVMMFHTIFLREHNRIATALGQLTDLTTDQIFEEARRIIGAEMQSMTYNGYLPEILGQTLHAMYGLDTNTASSYDSNVDPGIFNSFASAAFRFGHSQIYNRLSMANLDGELDNVASLASTFFRTDRFYANNGQDDMYRYLVGLAHEITEAVDTNFATAINSKLFKSNTPERESHIRKSTYLPAANLQRGREHGIPSCGEFMDLITAKTGTQFPNINNPETRAKDLFHCGLDEAHMPDAEIGAIFGHIIALQFRNIKYGDRYFYSHDNDTPYTFTAGQKAAIEKITLSRLICQHALQGHAQNNLNIVPNAFKIPSGDNVITPCAQLLQDMPTVTELIPAEYLK